MKKKICLLIDEPLHARLSATAFARDLYVHEVLLQAAAREVASYTASVELADWLAAGRPPRDAKPGRPERRPEETSPQFERGLAGRDPHRAYEGRNA